MILLQGLRTQNENEVQMGMWAIFAAPLLMSNDLRRLPRQAKDILLNEKLISISQDPLGELLGATSNLGFA